MMMDVADCASFTVSVNLMTTLKNLIFCSHVTIFNVIIGHPS